MEDDTGIDVHDDATTDITELEDEVLSARPRGGSHITDGTSNT